jgi:hypothetical protein
MTTTIESTQDDEEQEFANRVERLTEAILGMLSAADICGEEEAVCALISCVDVVVGSIECVDCRNGLVDSARRHFEEVMTAIEQRSASDEAPHPGHVH